jgi:hypothetical protein
MNVHHRLRIVLPAALAAPAMLPAQEQATTLAALAARAHVVATAFAAADTDPSPDFRRVEFRTIDSLEGAPGATFALLEPAGRCCGHALAAVEPGVPYLLFLERRGPTLHVLGGDRGLLRATPPLVSHVAALLAAAAPAARSAVLLDAFDSAEPRVRGDAILALAASPALPPSAALRERVHAALLAELPRAGTRLPALLDLVVRAGGPQTPQDLLRLYLDEGRAPLRALLGQAIVHLPADAVRDAVRAAPPGPDAPARIAELLLRMPDARNVPLLDAMLDQRPAPGTALALAEALAAAGVSPARLAGRVPEAVLQLLQRRRAAPPAFRWVRPEARP